MGRERDLEAVQNEEKVKVCPDCGNKEIGMEKGESFCKKCGLVFE